MRRAWRTHDFRAVFHLACRAGLTPGTIADNTGLPADLIVKVMKGDTTLNSNSGAAESIADAFGMPDDFRSAALLPPRVVTPAKLPFQSVPQPHEIKTPASARDKPDEPKHGLIPANVHIVSPKRRTSAGDVLKTSLWAERKARGWSSHKMAEVLRSTADDPDSLPHVTSLKRMLLDWEAGRKGVSERYRLLYCKAFQMTEDELFGALPLAVSQLENPSAAVIDSAGTSGSSLVRRPSRAPEGLGAVSAHTSLSGCTAIDSPEPGPDTIVLNLLLDGKEVAVPISRLLLLRAAGVSSFVEAFALDQQFEMVHDIMQRPGRAEQLTIASPAHLQEILIHQREQWHALVKADNLLGPRFALAGVLSQISVVEALRSILRDEQRIEVTRLGAKYAESAAWLYEDSDNMTQARSWASQAMEWAYEGNDERMLAWTIFRRAQQAAAIPDAAQTIGLAQAARRNEEKLATPTRAAIRVQEAYGHALDGNDQAAQRLLDEAHTWAAGDTVGDAREGHGSYCTPGYIEIERGHCWLATGRPKKAISLYEDGLRTLPTVYQRNRAATLTRLAVAYAADSQPEQAANTAHTALPAARSAGSKRIVGEIKNVGNELIPYRALPAVAALLDELEAEDH
jgi:tetratricopeptide (TPR) repeat protein/transcriptional regulator with XRE-family HTH domain